MNFQIVFDALVKIFTDIVNFIPNLVNGLIILLVGYLVARLVSSLIGFVLRQIKFDPLVERTGITGALRGLGVKTPLWQLVSQIIYVFLLLSFLITATRFMGLDAVARLLSQLLDLLPKAIAAVIVFLLGGIVSKFMGDLVTNGSKSAGISYASRLGIGVQYLASVFVAVLALGVLGIDTALLVTTITIALAAFGLALGLALGLGSRGVVQHLLAGYYLRQRLPAGQPVIFDQVRGDVSGIGGVNTVVTTEEGTVIIPNSTLMESIVHIPRRQAQDPSD
ncbi:MAG: mechanosensitive ion channel family protein [Acidobacteriota bacterium]